MSLDVWIAHFDWPTNLITIGVRPSSEPSLLIHLRARQPRDPRGLKGCYLYCQNPIPERSRSSSRAEEAKTDTREKPVPPEESAQIVQMLENARLHTWIPEPVAGLDGTSYELIFGSFYGGAHYWWWEKSPAGWEVLDDVVKRLMKLANAP